MIKFLLFLFLSFCVNEQKYNHNIFDKAKSDLEINKIEKMEDVEEAKNVENNEKYISKKSSELKKEIALILPEGNNFDDIIVDSLIFKLFNFQNATNVKYDNLKINFYYLGKNDKILNLNTDEFQVAILALNYDLSSKICKQYFEKIPCLSFAKYHHQNINSNFYPLGFSYDDQISSIFKYLLEKNKKEVIFILPSTKSGQEFLKTIFTKVNNYNNINISDIFFYNNEDDSLSTSSVVKKISKSLSRKIKVDKKGKHVKYKFQKNKILNDDNLDTQKVLVDTIFIMFDEEFKYQNILNELDAFDMFEKNILFLSNQIKIDPNAVNNKLLKNFVFIGNQFDLLDLFKEKFQNYFSYSPNYISYITYDIFSISLLDEISKKYPFSGLLGNIIFNPIQKRDFNIYKYSEVNNLFEIK